MPKLWIRADASQDIGHGHVMRSISLAQKWNELQGSPTSVILYNHCSQHLLDYSKQCSIDTVRLNDQLSVEELFDSIPELQSEDWILLDGYDFNASFQSQVYDRHKRLIVVDDFQRSLYKFQKVAINPNPVAENLDPNPNFLVGFKYIALRAEILNASLDHRPLNEKLSLLVNFGATDPSNFLEKVFPFLVQNHSLFKEIKIIGKEDLVSNVETPHNIEILAYVSNFEDYLLNCDVVFSAAGSTIWEAFYFNKPVVAVATAENQIETLDVLERVNLVKSLGWHRSVSKNEIDQLVDSFFKNRLLLNDFKTRYKDLDIGSGAERIVRHLQDLAEV